VTQLCLTTYHFPSFTHTTGMTHFLDDQVVPAAHVIALVKSETDRVAAVNCISNRDRNILFCLVRETARQFRHITSQLKRLVVLKMTWLCVMKSRLLESNNRTEKLKGVGIFAEDK